MTVQYWSTCCIGIGLHAYTSYCTVLARRSPSGSSSFPNAIMRVHTWIRVMSDAKKQEYYVKRVNKANSSPSKALYCYFYHRSACIMYISMNFSTPVRWHSAMRLFMGDISRLSEASLVCVFSLCLQLTWKQGCKSINGYWTHNDCCLYDDYGYHGCIQKMFIA